MSRSQRVIVVLGMHRSGTSVLSRGVQCLGVDLGDNLKTAPNPANPKGYWEDKDMVSINEELLSQLGLRWDSFRITPSISFDSVSINVLKQKAIKTLRRRFSRPMTAARRAG